MKFLPFVLCLFIAFAAQCFSFAVITKSGKTFVGYLIDESSDEVRIRDDSGLQLTFRKSNLDMNRMAAANAAAQHGTPVTSVKKCAKQKSPIRVFTLEDLQTAPVINIFG